MTDSRLRELERCWKQSGAVEDEAAYLLERVRVGDLEQQKLELAAYCGCEAARVALGENVDAILRERGLRGRQIVGPSADSLPRTRETDWGAGLPAWGEVPPIIAAVATAKEALPVWLESYADDTRPREAVDAVEDWLRSPSDDLLSAMVEAADNAREAAEEHSTRMLQMSAESDPEGLGSYTPDAVGRAALLAGSCYDADDSIDWIALATDKAAGRLSLGPAVIAVLSWALGNAPPHMT